MGLKDDVMGISSSSSALSLPLPSYEDLKAALGLDDFTLLWKALLVQLLALYLYEQLRKG